MPPESGTVEGGIGRFNPWLLENETTSLAENAVRPRKCWAESSTFTMLFPMAVSNRTWERTISPISFPFAPPVTGEKSSDSKKSFLS